MHNEIVRFDQGTILEWVNEKTSVLDLGCGDGELLALLIAKKQVRAQGVELSEDAIHHCVALGLSVFQQDIDSGLSEYGSNSFDYVILNQTLQQVKKPDVALSEALRVGKRVIVSFPNFVHISARLQILRGRVPVTKALPYEWYNTPNMHFLGIADFKDYCKKRDIQIEKSAALTRKGKVRILPNLIAETGLFLLMRPNSK